ncbi:MAG: class I SAM-dependent methyltransferase [Solirubrobacteraceae bacterium]
MQEISCVLCDHSHSVPIIYESGFTGRQCTECGLIFVSPRPSEREIAEVYEHGEAYLSPEFFVQSPEAVASLLRAQRDARLIRRYAPGGALLEIGPGRGTFLAAARREGFDVHGVELNPTQASFIRDRLGIACAESLDGASELGPGRFDLIYHRDVLSHFYDPHAEMGRLRDLLKPGGLHIFETGNLADVDHRYLKLIKAFQYPDHLFFYGGRSLAKLLDQTGFAHEHTHRWSMLPERWIRSQLNQIMARRASTHSDEAQSTAEVVRPAAGSGRVGAEGIARQALDSFYLALQLTAGRIPVSERVPQTLIVIARKR